MDGGWTEAGGKCGICISVAKLNADKSNRHGKEDEEVCLLVGLHRNHQLLKQQQQSHHQQEPKYKRDMLISMKVVLRNIIPTRSFVRFFFRVVAHVRFRCWVLGVPITEDDDSDVADTSVKMYPTPTLSIPLYLS